jgi:ATP-dependent RNA helicase MRH4
VSRASRTYGRGSEEDSFSPLPDDTFASETLQKDEAEELVQAAKKFKEVDRWELEFEEVIVSSSPVQGPVLVEE